MSDDEQPSRQAARVGSTLGVMIGLFLLICAIAAVLVWAI
jgi:hypothetical protein